MGLKLKDGPATLGFRAEDAKITDTPATAQITALTYAMELLGDATMVTVIAGNALVAVKAHMNSVQNCVKCIFLFRKQAVICLTARQVKDWEADASA